MDRPTLSTPKGLLVVKADAWSSVVGSPAALASSRAVLAALAFLSLRALAFFSFSRSRFAMMLFRDVLFG